jgi:hypothetical protein
MSETSCKTLANVLATIGIVSSLEFQTHQSMNVCDQGVTQASLFTILDIVKFFEFVSIVFYMPQYFSHLQIWRFAAHNYRDFRANAQRNPHFFTIAMPDR